MEHSENIFLITVMTINYTLRPEYQRVPISTIRQNSNLQDIFTVVFVYAKKEKLGPIQ